MITPATFRQSFPEFAVAGDYADSVLAYWIAIGVMFQNTGVWGVGATVAVSPPTTPYDFGLELFVAHNLAVERRNLLTAAAGGVPGEAKGPTSAKSVNGVSISYDTGAAAEEDAGWWNMSIYGQRYIRLAQQMGGVPLLIGVPGPAPPLSGPGWPGPFPWPAPSGTGFG